MSETYPGSGVTLDTCDLEPIHLIGRIQGFGWLIALSSDWLIQRASANCAEVLGAAADDVLGMPVSTYFPAAAIEALRQRLGDLDTGGMQRVFNLALTHDGRLFDVAIYRSGRSIVLEIEPASPGESLDYLALVRPMFAAARASASAEDLFGIAARQMRRLTGFDRVKVYRFDESGGGEVVAEARGEGIDSFQGLHFPASDIPRQARRLYQQNLLRIISDIDAPTIPVIPAIDARGEPLDLSASGLRAVSPIHIEYLRNMGVQASMSVSILRHGALWGLFACHHYTPRTLPHAIRTAAELFGEFFASTLDQVESQTALRLREHATALHDRIMAQVANGDSLLGTFDSVIDLIGQVIPFDGIVGFVNGDFLARGATPDEAQFHHLARFLNTTGTGTCWSSANLVAQFPPAAAYGDDCAGLLSVPVSRSPRDYIVLFRRAHVHDVHWAGNPGAPKTVGPLGERLTPRKSFALWKEERVHHSRAWSRAEIATAESLRVTLIEVILQLVDASAVEREAAAQRQQDLIAELNHRVRNSLNLIASLVTQGRRHASSVEAFGATISARIQALARAHDMVNATCWAPYPIATLIRTEVRERYPEAEDRLTITGVQALIRPSAFTTLAIVVHELVAASAALCGPAGRVAVTLSGAARGALEIAWRESGAVAGRRPLDGVATVILERSIPYELGGAAQFSDADGDLAATFTIPADRVDIMPFDPSVAIDVNRAEITPVEQPRLLSARALIVEDNVIIGLEAEDQLFAMGASIIDMASSVAHALALIERNTYEFALLDINLGNETSEPVAQVLSGLGIPYAFTTGYGQVPWAKGAHTAPVVTKPLDAIALERAIIAAMGAPA